LMDIDLKNENAQSFSEKLNIADKKELSAIIQNFFVEAPREKQDTLMNFANELREKYYERKVYFRALLEFSNYCKNDCYYCGLQRSNRKVNRYRLSAEEILACCKEGYSLGFRTFVLQSGEDSYYTDALLCRLVAQIKESYPDCAVTLSVGERSYSSYQQLYAAGADRYLLRHETADEVHYRKLHPSELSLQKRQECLYNLKEIGFQVGAGFMVDSPFQTYETLAADLIFLRELQPHMIGIGPFIPHADTRFAGYYKPTSHRTLVMLSLVRSMLPKVLLPATTALGSVDEKGREKGLRVGANVVMPNLSPVAHRLDYSLYDNKVSMGWEAAEYLPDLSRHLKTIGFIPDFSRGDYVDLQKKDETL